ncbi:homoserine O-acetyltransferase/O-succinyltransferase family protein [Peptoniphilus catoniae]|uniref:homoserine O-acetyltransferase/O-succinyltransferase family protein n=1 Tax=Peptoniphilus catoniae TaxID=1660341 RepID=UPI0010FCEB3A|nr:homoserine O-succinyltransferase [Peptoniphilus catoniae]
MPLIIPKDLISQDILKKEKIFTMDESRADTQDIRPLKIAIVNLMPKKEETELQLIRVLSNTALQINIDLVRMKSHNPKNTSEHHLEKFYKTYDEIKDSKYDAMIVTGAPVERLEYEKIKYWPELKKIFNFAKENVYSTMFICWSAQAALYHYYGIENETVEDKIFGVFDFEKLEDDKLVKGFDDVFSVPQSRYTYVKEEEVAKHKDLKIISSREDTGVGIVTTKDNRFVFSFGHWEYDKDTLHNEYIRDLEKNTKISLPKNYYLNDDSKNKILVRWRAVGNLFFSNWINYCVYQETPYKIEKIKRKQVSKFGGSSLSDSHQFSKVKNIIKEDKSRDVIVVSAPGKRHLRDTKVTDKLLDLYNSKSDLERLKAVLERIRLEIEDTDHRLKETTKEARERFEEIALNLDLKEDALMEINKVFNNIENSNSKDYIVSRGEYLNAKLMSIYLNYKFLDAKDLIVLDSKGQVDLKTSYEKIRKNIGQGEKVVVPGFYAGDEKGNVVLFDRGGSDYTGSIIAGALDVEVYENWTDVDGIMTADPNLDKNVKKYSSLSYSELSKIVDGGAGVYQKEAIEPVREKNITIKILNTNNPAGSGTEIKD